MGLRGELFLTGLTNFTLAAIIAIHGARVPKRALQPYMEAQLLRYTALEPISNPLPVAI